MPTQNPGERMHVYNILWYLERDLVDELTVTELYPAGSVHEEELENTYIHILVGPLISKLYDLRMIRSTLDQVMGCVRDTTSGGRLQLGLHLLQQYVVKLDNDQLISSELRKSLTHLGDVPRFSELEDENTEH